MPARKHEALSCWPCSDKHFYQRNDTRSNGTQVPAQQCRFDDQVQTRPTKHDSITNSQLRATGLQAGARKGGQEEVQTMFGCLLLRRDVLQTSLECPQFYLQRNSVECSQGFRRETSAAAAEIIELNVQYILGYIRCIYCCIFDAYIWSIKGVYVIILYVVYYVVYEVVYSCSI